MQAEIGLVGLGTMGAALALNIAEKGFDIAVFNRTTSVTRSFAADAGPLAAAHHPLRGPRPPSSPPSRRRAPSSSWSPPAPPSTR